VKEIRMRRAALVATVVLAFASAVDAGGFPYRNRPPVPDVREIKCGGQRGGEIRLRLDMVATAPVRNVWKWSARYVELAFTSDGSPNVSHGLDLRGRHRKDRRGVTRYSASHGGAQRVKLSAKFVGEQLVAMKLRMNGRTMAGIEGLAFGTIEPPLTLTEADVTETGVYAEQ
jgi:hypothetical protein